MKHRTNTRSSSRTTQSSEFSIAAPRLRPSVHAVRHALSGIAAVTALQLATPSAFALPIGESVQSGTVAFDRTVANQLNMTQSTNKASVNWTSFSIAAPEAVNIAQPTSSSVMLNRVVGSDQSQIFGALNANGKVFLVNPNGVLFAPGASVNVGGLVASTLDITETNFANGGVAGTPYVFDRQSGSAAASVVNQTNIAISVPNSYAALIGTNVSNEGTISVISTAVAARGAVALAAGDRVTLNIVGDNLINVSVDAAALGASVLNKNGAQMLADGGTIFLAARSADALLGTVVNNEGIIQANSLVSMDGKIFLDGGTDKVTISGGVSTGALSVTGGAIDITNSGATPIAVSATTSQTFTATQGDIDITNTGTGLLTVGTTTPGTLAQTFSALHGDINISSSGTGGVQVRTPVGPGNTQTFDTVTGALTGSTGNMTVKGTGGDVFVSSEGGTQTINLKGDLTVGDTAATKSSEVAINSSQVVNAASINVIGGSGNAAGAVIHSFGGQTIVATGAINITGGTAPAFGTPVIPNFTSSPSAGILNNTTGTQDIKAATININGGLSGSGNSASIGNFANSTQKITADTINVTGGVGSTTNNAIIQSGNNTFVSTLDLHAGTLNINGQTASGAVGGGNNAVIGVNVTGDTTLTGGTNAVGGAAIALVGTTTNNTITINFTGGGNLKLQAGTGATPGAAFIGAGQNHTNPTVNLDVKAANITLNASNNNGGAFIGNSNLQPTAGNGNISLTATNGDISLNASPDKGTLAAIRTAGATGGTVSLTASGDINLAGRIVTSNASDSAVVLRAGNGKAAGDATGGNVKIDNTTAQISVGAGGRATLFTGSILGSTGVTDFIGSGSGHFRYNSNPTTTNYSLALGAGNYAVYREQPLLNVTVTSTTDKIYGTNDPTPQTFTAAGYVNGDTAGLTGNFGRVGGESVGLYNITKGTLVSDVGYGFSFNQALTINAAATTASVASQSKTYGTNDPTLPIAATNLTGLVNTTVTDWNGTATVINDSALTSQANTLARNVGENVGSYLITGGTFSAPSTNYLAPTFTGTPTLTINQATLTATINNQTKTYGTDDPLLGTIPVNVAGVVNTAVTDWNGNHTVIDDRANVATTLTSLTRTAGENVAGSPYAITAGALNTTFINGAVGNYADLTALSVANNPTLAINQATLTATINSQTKAYGTDDPALAGIPLHVAGVVNTTVADWNGNHTLINDTANVATTLTSLTRTAGENVAGSPYAITAGALTTTLSGGAVGNYADLTALSVANNPTLSISALATTASVANQAKTYGADDPALPIPATNVTGLVNTTVADWNGNHTLINDSGLTSQALTLARNAGENVGSYLITGGTFSAPSTNYLAPTFTGAPTLMIGQATLTATINNQAKTYGTDDPLLGTIPVNVTGVVNRTVADWNGNHTVIDDRPNVTTTLTSLTRNPGENVAGSPYTITAGALNTTFIDGAVGNYAALTALSVANNPALAINAAATTASVANQTKTYGADDPTLPIPATNVTGLVNTAVADWNGNHTLINDSGLTSQALTLARNAGENVGSYLITGGTFSAPSTNYLAPTFSGAGAPALAINAAATTASVANQTKTYGADDPTLPIPATNVTGLVNRAVADWNGNHTVINDSGLTSQVLTLARNGGENVGIYLITGGTFSAPSLNYVAPTFSGAGAPALAINAAATTASVANQTKTYGADDPTLPIPATNVTGLVNRAVADWNGNHTVINDSGLTSQALTLARNAGENVGSYQVTGGTFSAPSTNYVAPTFTGTPTLTINQKGLIVTAQDATKIYDGNTSSSVSPSVSGLVNRTVTDWNGHGTVIADTSGFTQTYDNKDVGAGKTLTAAGIAIDGNGGANYAPTFVQSFNGVINRLGSVTWTGGGGNNLWSNAANWQGGAIPDKANVADVNLGGASVVFNSSVPTLAGSVQVNSVSGGALTVTNGTLNVATAATLTGYSQSAGLTQVGGNLSITSTAPVTQTGGSLVVTGTSTVGAGGAAITLNSASNDFKGQLTVIGGTVKVSDANGLTIQLTNTGETYVIANAGGGTADLAMKGTTGNLTAVSNGGTIAWDTLTTANAILISATPVINGTTNAGGITGPSSTGNVLAPNVTYTKFGDATGNAGNNLTVHGELVLVAKNLPRTGSGDFPSITAGNAIMDITSLQPGDRVKIVLNGTPGSLRLLADVGTFAFAAGSSAPGGVSTLDPQQVKVTFGGVSLTSTLDELSARAAISAAQQSALNSASSDARKSFGTDSVTQQIDMGFAGDVGIAPTMAHNVPLEGEIINTPPGVSESKAGTDTTGTPKCNPDPKTGLCK